MGNEMCTMCYKLHSAEESYYHGKDPFCNPECVKWWRILQAIEKIGCELERKNNMEADRYE